MKTIIFASRRLSVIRDGWRRKKEDRRQQQQQHQ